MNETLKTIHNLRSIHGNFTSQEVADEDLQTILDACVRAANASNRQSYSVVIVDDRELMGQLCGYQASKLLVFCVDYNRLVDTARYLEREYKPDRAANLITAAVDTTLAAQTAAIAARSLGIDVLFTNGIHRGDMRRVYDLLGLPEKYCFPLLALCLGYPAGEPPHLRGRLTGPGVFHYGRYQRLTDEEIDELVRSYDDPTLHLGTRYDRQNYDRFLEWYFDVWSGRWGQRDGKSQMLAILESAGLLEDEVETGAN
jgi:nitroreductase